MARRGRHRFVGLDSNDQRFKRIDALAYGKDQAIALLVENGYSKLVVWPPERLYQIDMSALRAACDYLGINWQVEIRYRPVTETHDGVYRPFPGVHRITMTYGHGYSVHPRLGVQFNATEALTESSKVLWHELKHAHQFERNPEEFLRQHLREKYLPHAERPSEIEATAAEQNHFTVHALTKPRRR